MKKEIGLKFHFFFVMLFPFLFFHANADFQFGDISIANVDNPSDGITIMDRNLGATTNDIESTDSWGYKYQWGNNYGFEDIKDCNNLLGEYFRSCITKSKDVIKKQRLGKDTNGAVYSDNYKNKGYYSDIFITTRGRGEYYGWSNPDYWSDGYHLDLWGGSDDNEENGWGLNLKNYNNRQGPCPNGYHVPSYGEWMYLTELREKSNFGKNSNSENYRTYFKLPRAGYRDASLGDLHRFEEEIDPYRFSSDDVGYYRSSSPIIKTHTDKEKTKYNHALFHGLYLGSYNKSDKINPDPYSNSSMDPNLYSTSPSRGYSIRCFKNVYEPSAVGNASTINNTTSNTKSLPIDDKTITSDTKVVNDKPNNNSMLNSGDIRGDEKIKGSSSNTVIDNAPTSSIKQWKTNDGNPSKILDNGYSIEMNNAYQFSLANGLSTASSIENANLDGSLTRIAMAKMLSYYAINILGKQPDVSMGFPFNDVPTELNTKYGNAATLAYQLGIMGKGNKNFNPYSIVTRKEFATSLSRLLYNTQDGQGVYFEPHILKLYNEGIIKNRDPDITEKRGYVMLMLMRTVN